VRHDEKQEKKADKRDKAKEQRKRKILKQQNKSSAAKSAAEGYAIADETPPGMPAPHWTTKNVL
jgi:hypothetical protein